MKKIEITLESLLSEIEKFYNPKVWHFITVNGVGIDDKTIELQWIFSKYGVKDEVVAFYVQTEFDTKVPSVVSLIPPAIMGEREVVDMFGVNVEGMEKGLYLDGDSLQTPLRPKV